MASSRTPFICARCARSLRTTRTLLPSSRTLSSNSSAAQTSQFPDDDVPRWRQTPARMKMPVRTRLRPNQPEWRVNERQEPLDEMYDRFIGAVALAQGAGKRGREMLSEEVKWLAITHKSFEHGKQGFNDRLAFLGKRILDLQASLALLSAPRAPKLGLLPARRSEVFQHAAIDSVENITHSAKMMMVSPRRLAQLAVTYGLDRVVRWKPRRSDDLASSGVDVVLAHAVYSIVGALALQNGGEVAGRVARERVLAPLGLR